MLSSLPHLEASDSHSGWISSRGPGHSQEQSAAWAYPEVHFDPLPVIQDYSAYTSYLDQLDRSYLGTPEAPRFILRSPGAIDGRNPVFEPPATQLAIECHYHQVMATTVWQLLNEGATDAAQCDHWAP